MWESAVKVGGVAGVLARLLILTGCRRSEIMELERKELGKDAIELSGKPTGGRAIQRSIRRPRFWEVRSIIVSRVRKTS
jgi:integrase